MTESPSIAHAAIQTKINYRSIGVMCQPNLSTKSTQTIPYPSPYSKSTNTDDLVPLGPPPEAEENLNDSILTHSDKAELDESYAPSGTEYETDTTCDARFDDSEENEDTEDEKQFLTFWSVLAPLFVFCLKCKQTASVHKVATKGTMLIVTLLCVDDHLSTWRSQPTVGNGLALGNLLLAAGILFSGATYSKIREVCDISKTNIFGKTRFYAIQKDYLFPVVNKIFEQKKLLILENIQDLSPEGIHLSGDGRCDSPGFNAKYGTYSFMQAVTNLILDFTITQVSQVSSSNAMEKFGFIKLLSSLENFGIKISSITTDRHIQIRAYLSKERPDIVHQFDIWHLAKSIKKDLILKSKSKKCENLKKWIKSVLNHFWWCCSTCNGDERILLEKWKSLLFHVRNKHTWKGYKHFHKCVHKRLSKTESSDVEWLSEGTDVYHALEQVVLNRNLLRDLSFVTEFNHTGQLEVFHSLLNKYCPKRQHFPMYGMIARHQLAILDFNCGVNLSRAVTSSGKDRFKYQFSKITQNWTCKPLKEEKKRPYLLEMTSEVVRVAQEKVSLALPPIPKLPENIASTPRPDTKELRENWRSRFSTPKKEK